MDQPAEDLSVGTIIIVAAVCGTIVLILLAILIFLCCRRHQAKRKDAEQHQRRMQAMRAANGDNNAHIKNGKGFDNPGMTGGDSIDFDDRAHAEVFVTGSSQHNPNYVMFDKHKARNGQAPNGYPPNIEHPHHHPHHHPQHHPQQNPPRYDDLEKKQPIDPRHQRPNNLNLSKENNESGKSTPDPTKPKKVIYEVIV